MRNVILGWSLGLICIGSLAGCESPQALRYGGCGDKACAPPRSSGDPCVSCQKAAPKMNAEAFPIKAETANPPGKLPALETFEQPAEPVSIQRTAAATGKLDEEIDPAESIVIPEVAKTIRKTPDADAGKPAVVVLVGNGEESSAEILSAKIQDVQADTFKSITGNVQPWRKTWRLRFAPVDREAVYGGSVVLEGTGLDRLRDGQTVRVQGVLIAPTDRASPARYRVQTLEVLD